MEQPALRFLGECPCVLNSTVEDGLRVVARMDRYCGGPRTSEILMQHVALGRIATSPSEGIVQTSRHRRRLRMKVNLRKPWQQGFEVGHSTAHLGRKLTQSLS
ncbi:hypothetical protein D9M70_549890 [compost metagenome]